MLLGDNNMEILGMKSDASIRVDHAKDRQKKNSSVIGKCEVSSTNLVVVKVGRSAPPDPDILPPCRVCDMAATGFHYGVNTCEACKGFFRRSLSVCGNYLCSSNGICKFGKGFKARTWCAYCRFQKCLAVGMCREGIRTGRYTHAKRAKYITELKRLKIYSECTVTQDDVLSPIECQCFRPNKAKKSETVSSRLQISCNNAEREIVTPDSGLYTECIDVDKLLDCCNTKLNIQVQSHMCDRSGDKQSVSGFEHERIDSKISYKQEDELESLTATIVNGYKQYNLYWKYFANENELREKQGRYCEERRTQDELFGKLKFLSRTEYYDFFNNTGIDIDGRGRLMSRCISDHEAMMKRRIDFMTGTEIFHDIPTPDLFKLLAGNTFEMVIFSIYKTIDPDMEVGIHTNGELFTIDQFLPFIYEFMKTMCGMTRRLVHLHLTTEELALLEMLCVLSTDRAPVDEPAKIEVLQLTMISCLRQELRRTRPNPDQTFYQIWNKVIALRDISDKYKEYVTKCLEEFPEFEMSPVVNDFIQLMLGIE